MDRPRGLPDRKLYKGVNVSSFFDEASYLAFCVHEFRPDDVLALTYPKCGTTYLQKLLYLVTRVDATGDIPTLDADKDAAVAYGQLYPEWLHRDETGHPPFPSFTLDDILHQASPRIFSSHLRADLLPPPVGRVLIMLRNPKDVYVSLHCMQNKLHTVPWCTTTDNVGSLDRFLPGANCDAIYGDYFGYMRHLQAYVNAYPSHCLVLYYEAFLSDFDAQLEVLAAFLGLAKLTPAKRQAVAAQASFRAMQAAHANSMRAMLFRKGECGDWKHYVDVATAQGRSPSAAQWARFDAELAALTDVPIAQPLWQWMH
ncbi:hypothetical protein SDRG_01031 [Saprolegnia diclina VS20]|uniref:Sulfotransferase domain-containing protein n=1 Tax=Saprolegnia diclina (strain VS20) TaxID=1156394 RepID=T0SGW3_SAPDV|nr:hypothetical protein SDRG_01031 [Saprolegnia diclina VS20]EQC42192.1 hypothetical protein SDRG_01031 [Saprolegnia diclina VS20]|eukprot:XP_008604761.1 hypothetical protein SDRG_01031 [Saprolegnia diclina VS20]